MAWLGRMIAPGRGLADRLPPMAALLAGAAMTLVLPLVWAGALLTVLALVGPWPIVHGLAAVALTKSTFAIQGLGDAAWAVEHALRRGDMEGARRGLSALCSRDAANLDAAALRQAAIESVAENASDSAVAPFFFYAIGGLPGALLYRAINTLDAMIGYRGRFEYLGKAAARLDDGLNLVPARITAWMLRWHGGRLGLDVAGARRIAARDGAATPSPNAGRPMATMAGLLGLRLAKPGVYQLGDAHRSVDPNDIGRAWDVARRTMLSSGLVVVVLAFARGGP